MKIALAVVLIATTAALAGCDSFEREYTLIRAEPAVDRSSPTIFKVRLKVDAQKRTVSWLQRAYDSEGDLGTQIENFDICDMFDRRNWHCRLPNFYIEMVDGNLRQQYWGERHTFTSRPVLPWDR